MLPACNVCGVEYVEEYDGPCQEWLSSATDEQIMSGYPPMCPGQVNFAQTADRVIARLTAERNTMREALKKIVAVYHDSGLSNAGAQDKTFSIASAALGEKNA